jgi:thymidylate synthase ThyX
MATKITEITGTWKSAKNKCRTTVNKAPSDVDASQEFIEDLLISEHSPIRMVGVAWSWEGIPYWVSTEWSRHKFEKFISTQRQDRTGIDRGKSPQETPVNFEGYANAQNLIDAWRKRLCTCATLDARGLAIEFKRELHKVEPQLANMLVPNCVYRCGCPEFKPCPFWQGFKEAYPDVDMTDIRARYKAYNSIFYPSSVDNK